MESSATMDVSQESLLNEASLVVREQSAFMKRAIEKGSLRDSLKHSSNMICELRTSSLSPRNYYELYMLVFHELHHLAAFFGEKKRHGRKMAELYESVQHAGNIIPRLYLLVTVGCCYMSSSEVVGVSNANAILSDMTELCKGVQHPMRGLFLRYYLTQMCKGRLPDDADNTQSTNGGAETGTMVAFDFLFQNFCESARLWVRMQHQGPAREKHKRESERHELRVLVGANLVRMSQLEGMNTEFYTGTAAPRILKQITSFRDVLSQQYLLDCVVQVFSDECHLRTLPRLLEALLNTHTDVDPQPVLHNLTKRLSQYVASNPSVMSDDLKVFDQFHAHILQLFQRFIDKHGNVNNDNAAHSNNSTGYERLSPSPPQSTAGSTGTSQALREALSCQLETQVTFINFTLAAYPTRVDFLDRILCASVNLLLAVFTEKEQIASPPQLLTALTELLAAPLRHMPLSIVRMEHYPNIIRMIAPQCRTEVARAMVVATLDVGKPLDDVDAVTRLFTFVAPLLQTNTAKTSPASSRRLRRSIDEYSDGDGEDESQTDMQLFAKLLHLVHHEDTDEEYTLLNSAKAVAMQKSSIADVQHILACLVYCALRLLRRVLAREYSMEAHVYATNSTAPTGGGGGSTTAAAAAARGDGEVEDLGGGCALATDADRSSTTGAVYDSEHQGAEVGDATQHDGTEDTFDTQHEFNNKNTDDDTGTGHHTNTTGTPDADYSNRDTASRQQQEHTSPPQISAQKILHYVHRVCLDLVPHNPECALNLLLAAAEGANFAAQFKSGPFEPICHEFLSQALVCFEEDLSESKCQMRALTIIVRTLCTMKCLEAENYDTLAAKITQHGARILRKSDSCRAVLLCTNLFWLNEDRRSDTRVLECLQKSLKIADTAVTSSSANTVLFIDILESYLHFYEQAVAGISRQTVVDLVSLCADNLSLSDIGDGKHKMERHFSNIVEYIRRMDKMEVHTQEGGEQLSRCYAGINIEKVEGVGQFLEIKLQ